MKNQLKDFIDDFTKDLPPVKKAAVKASLAIASVWDTEDLSTAERMEMLVCVFVANYYALREHFEAGIDEAVIDIIKKEFETLDELAKKQKGELEGLLIGGVDPRIIIQNKTLN